MAVYKVVYSPESIEEIRHIIEWYSAISTDLGKRFKNSLFNEIKLIKKSPFSRSVRYAQVRFAVIKNFPYAAHYTIDKTNPIIKIQAVFGFAQDDKENWRLRF